MSSDELLNKVKSIAEKNYPALKEKLSPVEQTFVLRLTDGGSYVIRLSDTVLDIQPGVHPSPIATLTTSTSDLKAILEGQTDAVKAFFQGKIQIRGDVFKTQVLNSLIRGVPQA
jgi:putative sterol carrier protein